MIQSTWRLSAVLVAVALVGCATPREVITVDGTLAGADAGGVTLPSTAEAHVELREKRANAGAAPRTVAVQVVPVRPGRPLRFSLAVPVSNVDPQADLSLLAEVRDGTRVLLEMTAQTPVPHGPVTGLVVHLRPAHSVQ